MLHWTQAVLLGSFEPLEAVFGFATAASRGRMPLYCSQLELEVSWLNFC